MLCNYACGTKMLGPALLGTIVASCRTWRALGHIARACPGVPPETVGALVEQLVRHRILYRADQPEPAAERAMARLAPWNPAAGFFHTTTKDVRFGTRAEAERVFAERVQDAPAPPGVKRFRNKPSLALPPPDLDGPFPGVLLARRTWRRFGLARLPLEELSVLLALTAGIHKWILGGPAGRSPLRTAPSGGARQPVDLYVVAARVSGLRKGLYHYAADRHRLVRLGGAARAGIARHLPQQEWYEDAAALVLFVASFERMVWRYEYARAYRAVLLEAGHLCQTFCLTATWRGLAPFCSIALADTATERDLGLDGISESVLYAAGVGVRDGQAESSLTPRDVSPPPVVPNPVFAKGDGEDHGVESAAAQHRLRAHDTRGTARGASRASRRQDGRRAGRLAARR